MIYTNLTKKAIKLMFEAHKEQKRESGEPYIIHPIDVSTTRPESIAHTLAPLPI